MTDATSPTNRELRRDERVRRRRRSAAGRRRRADTTRPVCRGCRADLRCALLDDAATCPRCGRSLRRSRPVAFTIGRRERLRSRRWAWIGPLVAILYVGWMVRTFTASPYRWSDERLVERWTTTTGRDRFAAIGELSMRIHDREILEPALLDRVAEDARGIVADDGRWPNGDAMGADEARRFERIVEGLVRAGRLDPAELASSVERTWAPPAIAAPRGRAAGTRQPLVAGAALSIEVDWPVAAAPGLESRVVLEDIVLVDAAGARFRPRAEAGERGIGPVLARGDSVRAQTLDVLLPASARPAPGPATLEVHLAVGLATETAGWSSRRDGPEHRVVRPDAWADDGVQRLDHVVEVPVTIAAP